MNVDMWIIQAGAVCAALIPIGIVARWITRKIQAAIARVRDVFDLVEHELNHNGGKTIKDTTARIDITLNRLAETDAALGRLDDRLESLGERFSQHILDSNAGRQAAIEEQKAMWNAIEAVATSHPKEQ